MIYTFDKYGDISSLTETQLKEADKDSSIFVKNTGRLKDGTPYWAYVAVRPSKYAIFMQAVATKTPLMLEEYGEIVECGFDEEVPHEVQEDMKALYGYDEHFMDDLARDIRKERAIFLKNQEDKRIEAIVAMLKKKV